MPRVQKDSVTPVAGENSGIVGGNYSESVLRDFIPAGDEVATGIIKIPEPPQEAVALGVPVSRAYHNDSIALAILARPAAKDNIDCQNYYQNKKNVFHLSPSRLSLFSLALPSSKMGLKVQDYRCWLVKEL